jgi:hypothetical protein
MWEGDRDSNPNFWPAHGHATSDPFQKKPPNILLSSEAVDVKYFIIRKLFCHQGLKTCQSFWQTLSSLTAKSKM